MTCGCFLAVEVLSSKENWFQWDSLTSSSPRKNYNLCSFLGLKGRKGEIRGALETHLFIGWFICWPFLWTRRQARPRDTDITPVLTAKGRQLRPRLLFRWCQLQLTEYPTQRVSILKGLCSQSYGFSSSHVWMWELNHKEVWETKNWHFQTMVLEKTLESPLDCEEIQPVNPKGYQSWIFIRRTDAEAEASLFWPPDVKNQVTGKDPDAGEGWRQWVTKDEKVWWHHWLNGHEFEKPQGDSEGHGVAELDMT